MIQVLRNMKEITNKDYLSYCSQNPSAVISGTKIALGASKQIKKFQPDNFSLERTNVWSFPAGEIGQHTRAITEAIGLLNWQEM